MAYMDHKKLFLMFTAIIKMPVRTKFMLRSVCPRRPVTEIGAGGQDIRSYKVTCKAEQCYKTVMTACSYGPRHRSSVGAPLRLWDRTLIRQKKGVQNLFDFLSHAEFHCRMHAINDGPPLAGTIRLSFHSVSASGSMSSTILSVRNLQQVVEVIVG